MRNKYAFGKNAVRRLWTQIGSWTWRSGQAHGAGRGEAHRLSQRRSCALHPQQLQQGSASGSRKTFPACQLHGTKELQIAALGLLAAILLTACGGHKQTEQVKVPPLPPPVAGPAPTQPPPAVETAPTQPEVAVLPPAKVLYTQTGMASWYGPHYNKRRAANGEIYDMTELTAAHLTIPLNSIARVTNLKTGGSVLLRITDRGPFVSDRILDLSRAAARKLSVYQRGTALVRIEVLETPSPIATGGRWCVQIGGFTDAEQAASLKEKLSRRYH